ncbi:MAG TPA: hypothetical protein VNW29_02710 [Candidatus Sulfotelmatobacter sp.]|jgi:hypothetical protein|nr:hypothetical protein [Candidatus Sulfotelmatobacter sp.]
MGAERLKSTVVASSSGEGTLTRKDYEKRQLFYQRLVRRRNELYQLPDAFRPHFYYTDVLLSHFDELKIDWKKENPTQGLLSAINYAILKKKPEEFVEIFGLADPKRLDEIITEVIQDPMMQQIIYDNAGREPVTAIPDRGIPLQYIFRHAFGEKPFRLVDLGGGYGLAGPLLNSRRYTKPDFPGKERISHYAKDVNITFGLCVDIREREQDIDWIQATYRPLAVNLPLVQDFYALLEEVSLETGKFPFLVADVRKPDTRKRIQEKLRMDNNNDKANAVLTSFMRQQLDKDPSSQDKFIQETIMPLLEEGGIWIDIGEELLESNKGQATSAVKVYEKRDGKLVLKGIPFVLQEQRNIQTVNLAYFGFS